MRPASPEELRGVPLAFTPYAGDELPPFVDLSRDMPPAGNQGSQNSCVGWAVAYALKSYQEKIEENWPMLQNGRLDTNHVFSPSFIYNQINNGRNAGVPYADAFNLLSEQGVATWEDMPYRESDYTSKPSAAAQSNAKRFKIDVWRQVNVRDAKELKAHIHSGYPILIGANIDVAFKKHPRGVPWSSIGQVIGAHAMVVVGYDDTRRAFKLLNSWGSDWADDGYCWADYEHFRRVVNEGYVVKDAINGPSPVDRPTPRPQPIPPRRQNAVLSVTNVEHNTYYQDRPDLGYFMKFAGNLFIPSGRGRADQVVIHFYFDAGGGQRGYPVRSLNAYYTDINGNTACGTAVYPIPPEGVSTYWQAWIPYDAFDVPAGQWVMTAQGQVYQQAVNHLIAEPTLFVDNFGVAQGETLRFFVRR